MRLWILSDLHIETSDWDLPSDPPDYDVLIAAGDIHTPCSEAVRWLGERADGRPVIHVPGNHEWYGWPRPFSVAAETARARDAAREAGVTLLMEDAAIVAGVRFLGATLWTDYDLYGARSESMAAAAAGLNDHRLIRPADAHGAALTPAQARAWHKSARAWIEAQLSAPFDGPTIVVTHHMPHPRSIDDRFVGNPLNPAFCSDLSDLVETGGAALWVHGHTHTSCDYVAGGARVVCNPKGYGPRRSGGRIENDGFDPYFTVEI